MLSIMNFIIQAVIILNKDLYKYNYIAYVLEENYVKGGLGAKAGQGSMDLFH